MSRQLFDQVIPFYTTSEQAEAIEMLARRLTFGNRAALMRLIVGLYLEHVGAVPHRPMANGHVEQREAV